MSARMAIILLAYVVICGGIAYLGDLLGRKMGKKRISLFGMRPKHTAIFITSMVGGLIAVSTILLLTGVNSVFRDLVLRGYDTVLAQRIQERELKQTTAELKQQSENLTELNKRVYVVQNNLREVNDQKRKLEQERDAKLAEVKRLQTKVATLNAESARLNRELQQKTVQIANQNQTINAQASKIALQGRLVRSQASEIRSQAKAILDQMDTLTKLTDENAKLASQNQAYQRSNNEISDRNLQLERQEIELTRNIDNLNRQNRDLVDRNLQLVNKNAELDRERDRLADVVDRYREFQQSKYVQVREGKIAFRSGEEVVRRSVVCGVPKEEARRQLEQVLVEARRAAVMRGAQPGNGADSAYIGVRRLPDGTVIDGSAVLNTLAEQIANSEGEVVLIGLAMMNTVQGEQVPIDLRPYRNHLVFSEGQEVAQVRVDARKRSEEMLSSLIEFLRQDVRSRAMQAGLIPVQEQDGQFAPVGQVDGLDLLELVDQLKSVRRPAVVSAVAAADTYSGGPLKLSFRVKPFVR